MASEIVVDIWNRALLRIAQTAQIADVDETSVEAKVCRRVWDDCLGEILEDFPWSFAKAQKAIAELTAVTRVGWEYAYELPSDCLVPRALLDGEVRFSLVASDANPPWEIQANDARDGKILCTDSDLSDGVLEYTALVTNVVAYPRVFVDALAWRLAAELAIGIKQDHDLHDRIMDPRGGAYARAFAHAATLDLRTRGEDQELDPPSIRARE